MTNWPGRIAACCLLLASVVLAQTPSKPTGLHLGSIPNPPADIVYSSNPLISTAAIAISPDSPTFSGGLPASYSVSPTLPSGLALNSISGIISGTPETAVAQATYAVTASNVGGSTTAVVSITINASSGTTSGPTINGCPMFNSNFSYNVDVSSWPLDPNSANYISFTTNNQTGNNFSFSPDYYYNFVNSGNSTMIQVVAQKTYHPINFLTPVNADPLVEPTSDHHALFIDSDNCYDYEFYGWTSLGGGSYSAYEGSEWDLTSAGTMVSGGPVTAAGTPITPDIIRYSEVEAGAINHAVGFMMNTPIVSQTHYVAPATMDDGCCDSPTSNNALAYGMRLRLKSSFNTSGFGPQSQVILAAMKKYGIVLTDLAGSNELRVEISTGWNNSDVDKINNLTITDFEVPITPTIKTGGSCFGTCGNQ